MTTLAVPSTSSHRPFGVALILIAAAAWSFSGLLTKKLSVDVWTATFARALIAALFLAAVLVIQRGRQSAVILGASAVAAPGAILSGAVSMVLLIAAYRNTSVANVVVIYATAPFWATGLAWLLRGERADRRTLLAAAVALAGVVVIVGGSGLGTSLVGDLFAVAMTVTFILAAVWLGMTPGADPVAATLITCIVCATLCAPLAVPATIDADNLFWLVLLGISTSGIAYLCFMAGVRHIPATEAGLLGLIEIPLAALWAYAFIGERPTRATWIGGGMIIAIVLWHQLSADSVSRRRAA